MEERGKREEEERLRESVRKNLALVIGDDEDLREGIVSRRLAIALIEARLEPGAQQLQARR